MRGFLFSFDFISILVAQSRSMSASGQNIERLQREREDISFIYFSFHTWTVRVCLRLQQRWRFKMFFVQKYIRVKFFYFLKIIFDISTSKRSENTKKKFKQKKKENKNFQNLSERGLHVPMSRLGACVCIFVFFCEQICWCLPGPIFLMMAQLVMFLCHPLFNLRILNFINDFCNCRLLTSIRLWMLMALNFGATLLAMSLVLPCSWQILPVFECSILETIHVKKIGIFVLLRCHNSLLTYA